MQKKLAINSALINNFSLIIAVVILVLSCAAFAFNNFITQYPGNNYFPPNVFLITVTLGLLLYGTYLLFTQNSPYFKMVQEFCYFFLVIAVIATATNAVQYTPFQPIDDKLASIDSTLTIQLPKLVAWTISIPWLQHILAFCYNSLPYQMCYLPLLLIVTRNYSYIKEFYALVLLATLLGFSFYYFFPSIGPASTFNSACFNKEQYATGIKFSQIHHYIAPSTLDGGLIAMPSFHVIWAWLCLYCCRGVPILFFLLLPCTLLLIVSCVLLGWHYFVDLLGSFVILAFTHWIIHYYTSARLVPLNESKLSF